MRDLIDLVEGAGDAGLVVSYIDGDFEDFEIVDLNTQMPVQGHVRNVFNGIMEELRGHGRTAFQLFSLYVRKKLGDGIKLGDDYADQGPEDRYVMYPVTAEQLSALGNDFFKNVL